MFVNTTGSKLSKISKINKSWLFAMVFSLLIFFDQLTKHLSLNIYKNKDFAFSLPIPNYISYIIYVVVLFFIFRHLYKNRFGLKGYEILAWIFILSGAMSNIVERIFFGFVKDWFYVSAFGWTGVYNLADGYILLGITILIVQNVNTKN